MRDFVASRVDLALNSHGVYPARYYGRFNEDVGDLADVDDRRNGFLGANHSLYDAAMWAIMMVCIYRCHMSVHRLIPYARRPIKYLR